MTQEQPTGGEQYEIDFRRLNGLRHDLAHIRGLKNRPDAQRPYGMNMLPAEVARMEEIERISETAGDVGVEARRVEPDRMAGFWMDAGELYVASTEEFPEASKAKVVARAPSGARVNFVRAQYSLQELLDLEAQLGRDNLEWRTLGVFILSTAVSHSKNRVEVDVRGSAAAAEAAFNARYNSHGKIIVLGNREPASEQGTTEFRDYTYGPAYGGQWMNRGGTSGQCTMGVAHGLSKSNLTSRYLITAGHCGGGSRDYTWAMGKNNSPGDLLGNMVKHTLVFGGSSNCDCAIIGPIHDKWTAKVREANNALYQYLATSRESNGTDSGSYWQGRTVCMSGARSAETHPLDGITCTGIANGYTNNVYRAGTNTTINNTVSTYDLGTYAPLIGDSGAPWGAGQVWMGIHAGLLPGTNKAYFSKAYEVGALNVSFDYSR